MQFPSIPLITRARRVIRLLLRARRIRFVERAMREAWPETKSRLDSETPPSRAAYLRARVDLDIWAWAHNVPFTPFDGTLDRRSDEGGEAVLI